MLIEEIEKLREHLDDMVAKYGFSSEEVLRVSMELDLLILKYLKCSQFYECRK